MRIYAQGDSVTAGFDSEHWLTKVPGGAFADRLGELWRDRTGQSARVDIGAHTGFVSARIRRSLARPAATDLLARADVILLNGGGNDFLEAPRAKPADLCDESAYAPIVDRMLGQWRGMIAEVRHHASPRARVVALTIYYGRLDRDARIDCQGRTSPSVPEAFLRQLARANDGICRQAQAAGYGCLDLMAEMNCADRDREACRWRAGEGTEAYVGRMMQRLRDGSLRDASRKGLVQADDLHPSPAANERFAEALYRLVTRPAPR